MRKWYFLSERGLERERSHISYGVNYELEDLLVRMTDGTVIAPRNSGTFRLARSIPRVGKGIGWAVGRTLGRYEPFRVSDEVSGERILFIMGMGSRSLRLLNAIPDWRRNFDLVVGFVLDAFEPFPMEVASNLDHLFMIIPDLVDGLKRHLNIPVTFLPLACNVLELGSARTQRSIDVLAYGRQWEAYAEELDRHFLSPVNPHLYLTTFSHPRALDTQHQRKQFWSVLSRTRISLAFVPDSSQTRFQGLPVITARWYEGLAAGCVMVGRRPNNPMFEKLFNWTDAAIELPNVPTEAPEMIEALLAQPERLERAHLRNHLMMLRRLDARLTFETLCKAMGLELPAGATRELERLHEHADRLQNTAVEFGVAAEPSTQPSRQVASIT
jgi:hypothetical protein